MNKSFFIYVMQLFAVFMIVSCSDDDGPDNFEPKLFVDGAVDITRTEATVEGHADLRGNQSKPTFTFEYGTDESSMDMSVPAVGGDNGAVKARLTGLDAGTQYYFRLKGDNGRVVLSSAVETFTTMPNDLPTITGLSLLSQGPMSAIVSFGITDDGGEAITDVGCYVVDMETGETTKVEADDSNKYEGSECRIVIRGLRQKAEYELLPYASNRVGETKGEALSLSTGYAVKTSEPGELASLMADDLYLYTELSFAGPMNGDDFRCLRAMMGRGTEGEDTPGQLVHVDITDVRIVAGGSSYDMQHYTEDNVVGSGFFADCSALEDVALPATAVKVGRDAFKGCQSLKQIQIPASVSSVEHSDGCVGLESIDVSPANSTYASVNGVLFDAGVTDILWFPMGKTGYYELPSTVTSIGDYAFRSCSITQFVLPDGIKEIGKGAFYGSLVEYVALPDGLTLIPSGTFQECNRLKEVRFGESTDNVAEYAFDGCPLENLYIPTEIPPVCDKNAFGQTADNIFQQCVLHVPSSSVTWYKEDREWGRFDKIIGIE